MSTTGEVKATQYHVRGAMYMIPLKKPTYKVQCTPEPPKSKPQARNAYDIDMCVCISLVSTTKRRTEETRYGVQCTSLLRCMKKGKERKEGKKKGYEVGEVGEVG